MFSSRQNLFLALSHACRSTRRCVKKYSTDEVYNSSQNYKSKLYLSFKILLNMFSNLSDCSRHKEWFPGLTRRKWPLKEVISPHPSIIDWRNSSRFSMWLATQCSLKTRDSTRFGGESAGLPTSEQLLRAIPRLQRHRASADHVTTPAPVESEVRSGVIIANN